MSYPGAEHDRGLIERLTAVVGSNDPGVVELQKQFKRREENWKTANRPLPDPDSLYGRIFAAIWQTTYGKPIFETVDTMEIAMMRVKTWALADAICDELTEIGIK